MAVQVEPQALPPRQVAHVIHRLDAEAFDGVAAHQAQIAAQALDLARVVQALAQQPHGFLVGGGKCHHTAPAVQRRFKAGDGGQRPCALQHGLPAGRGEAVFGLQVEQFNERSQGPLQRLDRPCPGGQQRRQMVLPLLQQTIGVGLRHDQDVCVASLVGVCGAQQLKAGAGITGRCTHAAHGGQEDLDVCGAGLVGQDDGGLGQVRHPGERETAVGIGRQIGHGQIVVKTREVDGGLWIDGRKQFGRRR